jgi:hypothetical protein
LPKFSSLKLLGMDHSRKPVTNSTFIVAFVAAMCLPRHCLEMALHTILLPS